MRWGALRKIKVKLRVTLGPLGNEWFGLASHHHGVYKIYAGRSNDFTHTFKAMFDSQRKSSGVNCQSMQTPFPTNASLLMERF
jgi:hypothetical protein